MKKHMELWKPRENHHASAKTLQASASDPENAYLSISTPPLSHEASPSSSGLPEATLQEARRAYHKFAEVVEPPREEYVLTLKLNFSGLARPKGTNSSTLLFQVPIVLELQSIALRALGASAQIA